jgi:predicted transcriptional regulator of viral defense system
MKPKDTILKIASENEGLIMAKQLSDKGIERTYLRKLVEDGLLIRVQRGIYVTPEGFADDLFLLQQKYSKGIFSHETALYLLGYSDRVPEKWTMSFRQGTSTVGMRENEVHPIMVSHHFHLGETDVARTEKTSVKVYSMERTVVDLMKARYDPDLEQFYPAMRRYMHSKSRDLNKLFQIAHVFHVEKKLRERIGILF